MTAAPIHSVAEVIATSMRRRAREELQCCICLCRLRSARLLPCEHTFCGRCIDRAAACEPGCRCPLCKRTGSSRGFQRRAPPIDAVLRVVRLLATEGGSDSPEPTSGDDEDTSTPDDFAPPPPSAPSQPLFDGAGVVGDAAVASATTGSTVCAPATVTDGLCVVGGDHVINTPGPQAALAPSSSPSPGSELLSTTTSPLAPAGAVCSLCGTDPADVETVKEILVSTLKRFPNVADTQLARVLTPALLTSRFGPVHVHNGVPAHDICAALATSAENGTGNLSSLDTRCRCCRRPGATAVCTFAGCGRRYHATCALIAGPGVVTIHDGKSLTCTKHLLE